MPDDRYLSPCAVARRLGVRDGKVYGWIAAGELRAANLATRAGSRPRYRIDPQDLDAFISARQSVVTVAPVRRRRAADAAVIQFY
jgi:excisionase family DNA binding protein